MQRTPVLDIETNHGPRTSSVNPQALLEDSEDQSRRATPYGDGRGSFNLYLTEIGKVKLLTPEEEIELAGRVQAGDKEAREQMIKANLRLVVKLARDYEGLGLPLMDLIGEGNIGLMKAVERFDPTRGAKLSTYAAWWIKQAMKRALANQSKTIRLPTHMIEKICRMHRVARELTAVLGREPSDEELATELGTTVLRVGQMRVAGNRPVSLDAAVGDEDTAFGELVEDENAEMPNEKLESKAGMRMLREMVAKLSPREAEVVRARFGLDGTGPKMLDEIGDALGITRERVRQIQAKSLTKLRKMMRKMGVPQADGILMLAA